MSRHPQAVVHLGDWEWGTAKVRYPGVADLGGIHVKHPDLDSVLRNHRVGGVVVCWSCEAEQH